MTTAIIHRYDNEPDILAIEQNQCSEVYQRCRVDSFSLVIVVPTVAAKSDIAVVADAASEQYRPAQSADWPGRPDKYVYRTDVKNVRYTTLEWVRSLIEDAGVNWKAAWKVNNISLNGNLLQRLENAPVVPVFGDRRFIGPGGTLPDEHVPEENNVYREGAVRKVLVNAYERDTKAREDCIAHYGAWCHVCEFDFGKKYGNLAAGFVHVHHLRALADIREEYKVDPVKDLRPVCPNCHAVLHMRRPAYSIEEVKRFIRNAEQFQKRLLSEETS